MTPKKTILRSRRKVNLEQKPRVQKKETFIDKITLSVLYGGKVNVHVLEFEEEPLTLKEMYNNGFLGDLELPIGDKIHPAEVEAGPVGQFNGTILGRFVFRIQDPVTKVPEPARVVKFSFKKKFV